MVTVSQIREEGGWSPPTSRQAVPVLSKIIAVNQKGIQSTWKGIQTGGCER